MKRIWALVLLAATAACGSDSKHNVTSSGGGTVACRQKDGADTDKDCAGRDGTPRKLDCDDATQQKEAIDAGCVAEKAGSNDVCCPTSVDGTKESSSGGGGNSGGETSIACTEPSDTLTDSDCQGTSTPRKLDCVSAEQQKAGIDLGCRPEHADAPTDFDLCCPLSVRGGG